MNSPAESSPGQLHWAAAAAAAGLLVVLLVLVVVVLPPRFTAHRRFDKASEELKAQNDVRTTLLQGLGALLVLTGAGIGAAVTLRQIRVSQGQLQTTREQMQHTLDTTRQQLDLTAQGQITDRYTKAVDQLGSEHLDVRVGGIYALERIARDSPDDRATIEEVLTAFVRGHAPWPPPPAPPSLQAITLRLVTFAQRQRSALQRRTAKDTAGQNQPGGPDEQGAEAQGPAADVQAAVTVLGRRELPPDGLRRLDLSQVDLRGASLLDANLHRALLNSADLRGAKLFDANLQGALAGEATRWPDGWDRARAEARGVTKPPNASAVSLYTQGGTGCATAAVGLSIPAVSTARRSVIDPQFGEE